MLRDKTDINKGEGNSFIVRIVWRTNNILYNVLFKFLYVHMQVRVSAKYNSDLHGVFSLKKIFMDRSLHGKTVLFVSFG